MEDQPSPPADRCRYPNETVVEQTRTLTARRKIVICLIAVCGLAALAWLAVTVPFFLAMRERERYVEAVFMPFAELHADFLHNGFGVYVLEFHSHSRLSDDNIDRLLLLNDLPQKYDLTILIETENVTDASIDTLAQLASVDSLFVDKSGMTPKGVAKLDSLLPADTVSHYTWENRDNDEMHGSGGGRAFSSGESTSAAP